MTEPQKAAGRTRWQTVRDEVQRQIGDGTWKPGDTIPNEIDIAAEIGCARTTVNRALRELADAGLLDRRRKGGTRVALHPVRKAVLDIPVIRLEIEARGERYDYRLISQNRCAPPAAILSRLKLSRRSKLLHLRALHSADKRAFLYEDRWINFAVVPEILTVDLARLSANEWLVGHAPLTTGTIGFSAASLSAKEAAIFGTGAGAAVLAQTRTTWLGGAAVTFVRGLYAPGHEIVSAL